MYVLVISQETHYRNALVAALISRGYLAAGVCSPQEGLRLIRNTPPNVILVCDAAILPKWQVETLRSFDALADKPILLICREKPESLWMDRWGVEMCMSPLAGAPAIVDEMSEWLVH
jgi:DNA-binding response OmpR family regulator